MNILEMLINFINRQKQFSKEREFIEGYNKVIELAFIYGHDSNRIYEKIYTEEELGVESDEYIKGMDSAVNTLNIIGFSAIQDDRQRYGIRNAQWF